MVSFVVELLFDFFLWVGGEKLLRKLGLWNDTKHREARFDKDGKLIKDD